MSSSSTRVAVIHDGYIPTYRVRLYELLSERSELEYVVFHGRPAARTAAVAAEEPLAFPNVEVRNLEFPLGRKSIIYQTLLTHVLRGGFDALVVGAFLRFISSLMLLPAFKLSRRPVIFWGQGFDKEQDVGSLLRMALGAGAWAKSSMARLGDGYLVYTAGGRERLLAAGLEPDRVFAVRNTLDVEEQSRLHARLERADQGALRSELGLRSDSVVLLYVGRLYPEKRVEELVEATRMIGDATTRPVEVVLIGDGPAIAGLRTRAAGLSNVHFRGKIRDQFEVARHMRVAAAVVIPGAVGLAVNHAFGQGRPIITRRSPFHGPELEYVDHGRNGLVVEGDMEAFGRALAEFIDSPALQERLAMGALETRQSLGMETMAQSFDAGVRAILGLCGRTLDAAAPQEA